MNRRKFAGGLVALLAGIPLVGALFKTSTHDSKPKVYVVDILSSGKACYSQRFSPNGTIVEEIKLPARIALDENGDLIQINGVCLYARVSEPDKTEAHCSQGTDVVVYKNVECSTVWSIKGFEQWHSQTFSALS